MHRITIKIMILLTLVLLGLGVFSSATEEPSCEQASPEHCFAVDHGRFHLPNSEEALNKMCPLLLPKYKCLVDFNSKCNITYPGSFEKKLVIIYDLMVEACDKESKLHEELATHLPCIEKVFTGYHNACKPIIKESVEEMTSGLNRGNEEDSLKYYCLKETIDMSCFVASTTVQCGGETKALVEKVLNRVGFLDGSCPESIREEMQEAFVSVQPGMIQKLATEASNI